MIRLLKIFYNKKWLHLKSFFSFLGKFYSVTSKELIVLSNSETG